MLRDFVCFYLMCSVGRPRRRLSQLMSVLSKALDSRATSFLLSQNEPRILRMRSGISGKKLGKREKSFSQISEIFYGFKQKWRLLCTEEELAKIMRPGLRVVRGKD